jgi:hypothetical protein
MPQKYRLPSFDITPPKSTNDAYQLLNKVAVRRQCPC